MLLQMAGLLSYDEIIFHCICIYIYVTSFIHSSVAKDLDCFHICLLWKMLFTHLLAIWMSCMGSLFILDINHLPNIRFASIFSHSKIKIAFLLCWLFILLCFLFDIVPLVDFSFCCCLRFWCQIKKKKNHCPDQCQGASFICLLIRVLQCYVLYTSYV